MHIATQNQRVFVQTATHVVLRAYMLSYNLYTHASITNLRYKTTHE